MEAFFLLEIRMAYASSSVAPISPGKQQTGEEVTGQLTRIWLQVQSQNMLATSHKDTLTLEAATAAQQRSEKTFSHSTSEKFIKNDFGG